MTPEPLTCPYCNTQVAVAAGTPPGQRVPCPRCGEAFPYRPGANAAPAAAPSASAAVALAPPGSAADVQVGRRRWPNWLVAGTVLGVMAVMAAVGLVWALKTVPDRRGRDRKQPVGYLPGDVDVVALVHVTGAMDDPAGRAALQAFGLGPGGGGGLINLEAWTGLRAEDIDQVAVGLKVKDHAFPPRLVLVVQTRESYDPDRLRETLDAKRPGERHGKTVYPCTLGKLSAELWCPTDTILILGLTPSDLDAVPLTPQPGTAHLSRELHALLSDQMGQGARAMLVADTKDWSERAPPVAMIASQTVLKGPEHKVWKQAQAIGLWLRFEQSVHLSIAVRCADEAAARSLHEYLVKNELADPKTVEVRKDVWVTVQTETSPETVRQAVRQALRGLPGARGK